MKRIFAIMFLIALFLFFISFNFVSGEGLRNCIECYGKDYTLCTYKKLEYDGKKIGKLNIYMIENFISFDEYFNSENVSFSFTLNDEDYAQIEYFNKLKFVFSEKICDIEFIYLYDCELDKMLTICNQSFNIQIAVCDKYVKVGYPAIIDSI